MNLYDGEPAHGSSPSVSSDLVFDGYDLVVYGTVVSTLLRDPEWALTPAQAGAIGSYALFGMMVGALAAGAVGDFIGRRRLLLASIAWFSVGMGLTALAPSVTLFGAGRFFTGIGIGALVAGRGCHRRRVRPAREAKSLQRDRLRRLSGRRSAGQHRRAGGPGTVRVPCSVLDRGASAGHAPAAGSGQAARIAGMAALPWSARGGSRGQRAHRCSAAGRRGAPVKAAKRSRGGLVGLFTGKYAIATILIGFMSAGGLMLTYALNTWLPELMGRAGFSVKGSLSFLLVLNGGAIIGSVFASRFADRFGAKHRDRGHVHPRGDVDRRPDAHAAVARAVAVRRDGGLGTIGTQVLIYGFVSNYYETSSRQPAWPGRPDSVAWGVSRVRSSEGSCSPQASTSHGSS